MVPMLLLPPPQGEGGGAGSGLISLLPLILIFFIFYFLVLRPQARRQKETQKMLESLKQGDRVVTSGGIYGKVVGIKDTIAVLKISDQVKVEVAKSAITGVVEKSREA